MDVGSGSGETKDKNTFSRLGESPIDSMDPMISNNPPSESSRFELVFSIIVEVLHWLPTGPK